MGLGLTLIAIGLGIILATAVVGFIVWTLSAKDGGDVLPDPE